jgi:hypothetical protein
MSANLPASVHARLLNRANAQAALLIKLVTAYPDTVERLAAL